MCLMSHYLENVQIGQFLENVHSQFLENVQISQFLENVQIANNYENK